ncbi:hypothetical protein [Eubacterium pyruvativorans]|uniref:hypothetical protein n=1 Tax=Eubacterium pyruvativorans TaxID=155865 RepID=UPI001569DA8D|nr:hypothetical protein [Eubacterium pyruvativorans]
MNYVNESTTENSTRDLRHETEELLRDTFDIDPRVVELTEAAEDRVRDQFRRLEHIMAYNQYKVLDAFQKNGISMPKHRTDKNR